MAQIKTQNMTVKDLISRKWFKVGFNTASKPFYEAYKLVEKSEENDQWFFERGRQFAVWLRTKNLDVPLEVKGKVSEAAVFALQFASYKKEVIIT